MNEQDKQAFEAFWPSVGQTIGKVASELTWKGALEYARQKQEPIYIVGKGWQCDEMPPEGMKLYTTPPILPDLAELLTLINITEDLLAGYLDTFEKSGIAVSMNYGKKVLEKLRSTLVKYGANI